jgi:hypothetical protein
MLAGAAWLAGVGLAAATPAPAARCDDATFLRRATLDLAGRQPTAAEIEAFSSADAATKRAEAIDRLLADPDWARTWARYFRDVILYRRTDERALLMAGPVEDFLARRLRDDPRWDAIAREFITATGPPSTHGETAIVMAQMGETADIAAEVSRIFLGIQIQCAQCHDHFTDRWKRPQFHEFAAFFPRIVIRRGTGEGLDRFEVDSFDSAPRRARGKMADNPRRGDLEHEMPDIEDPSRPGTVMTPRFFLTGGTVPQGTTDQDRRRAVAGWITGDDQPWFDRAIVNRIWAELIGSGFYRGVDDIGPVCVGCSTRSRHARSTSGRAARGRIPNGPPSPPTARSGSGRTSSSIRCSRHWPLTSRRPPERWHATATPRARGQAAASSPPRGPCSPRSSATTRACRERKSWARSRRRCS